MANRSRAWRCRTRSTRCADRSTPPIKLSVRREGVAPFDVTLTRAVIKIETVKSKLVDNVGYIRLTQFAENTDWACARRSTR